MLTGTEPSSANTGAMQQTGANPVDCDAQPPRILIVDDDQDTLTILRYFLGSLGFEILSAQDGTAAWALTQECLPDLILTDYMMPEMTGVELAQRVRSNARTRHIPVLMHSAYDAMHELEDAPYDDWFDKPTDLTRLGETIRDRVALGRASCP
jgi:CheY-like chemotaxis protein